MPGIDVRMGTYGDRGAGSGNDRYNSEDSLEDNQSTTSSTESRQSDFHRKEHEFIPTRSSGIIASKPAANPAQFTRVNSNPLLISAQKQMLLVEEVRKKKKEITVGEEVPEWQSNLDVWKNRRRKQSEEALTRISEVRRIELDEVENGMGKRKVSLGRKISLQVENDDEIDLEDLPSEETGRVSREARRSQEPEIREEPEEEEEDDEPEQGHGGGEERGRGAVAEPSSHSSSSTARSSLQKEDSRQHNGASGGGGGGEEEDPYQTAIEGYRSFARAQLASTEKPAAAAAPVPAAEIPKVNGSSSNSSKEGAARPFAATRLQSQTSVTSTTTVSSAENSFSSSKEEEQWEQRIETFVQPARKMSAELSDKMKLKLASFEAEAARAAAASSVSRTIEPDNTFREKLKVFKSIETEASAPPPPPPARRDSENGVPVAAAAPPPLRRDSDNAWLQRAAASRTDNSVKPAVAEAADRRPEGPGRLPSISSFVQQQQPPPANSRRASEQLAASSHKLRGEMGPPFRSSSSSALMNTIQNNKFFQQNSLSEGESEGDEQLVEDALEESFSVLEEKEEDNTTPLFSADDFIPSTERLAPPSEKPPPLPTVPPPPLDQARLREDELAQQEREIIESLEREEKEKTGSERRVSSGKLSSQQLHHHQQQEQLHTSQQQQQQLSFKQQEQQLFQQQQHTVRTQQQQHHSQTTTVVQSASVSTQASHRSFPGHSAALTSAGPELTARSSPRHQAAAASSPRNSPLAGAASPASGGGSPMVEMRRGGRASVSGSEGSATAAAVAAAPRRKSEGPSKDYNRHWLIQEAEQRRISEAKQRQHSQDRMENINNNINILTTNNNYNNNLPAVRGGYQDKSRNIISDNIYANVDPAGNNFNRTNSVGGYATEPAVGPPHLAPGPQIPPRAAAEGGGGGQERVLSVSGKKKCSHCKEELGRGAAMIIESLRLFYHIKCFKCCVCSVQLGNGEHGTDVRVRNNRLHCQNCYSNDEGLKFSKV